ncbi:hypothetical protein YC2023_067816 [Brassica napus]
MDKGRPHFIYGCLELEKELEWVKGRKRGKLKPCLHATTIKTQILSESEKPTFLFQQLCKLSH